LYEAGSCWFPRVGERTLIKRLEAAQIPQYRHYDRQGVTVTVHCGDLFPLLPLSQQKRITERAERFYEQLDATVRGADGRGVDGDRFMAVVAELRGLADWALAFLIAMAPDAGKGRVEAAVRLAHATEGLREAFSSAPVAGDVASGTRAYFHDIVDALVDGRLLPRHVADDAAA
jgi:hypothetical protein